MANTKLGHDNADRHWTEVTRVDRADSPGGREGSGMSVVGVVGLGAMGSAIAGRLLDLGHQVHGTNRTAAKARAAGRAGAACGTTRRVRSPRPCEVVISMVTDDAALDGGRHRTGRHRRRAACRAGVRRHEQRQPAGQCRAGPAGVRPVGAPVGRSRLREHPAGAAGQSRDHGRRRHRRVPARRAAAAPARQTVTHVGGNGKGVLLKLAINISLAVQTLAFSEGLLLAERGGVDRRRSRPG